MAASVHQKINERANPALKNSQASQSYERIIMPEVTLHQRINLRASMQKRRRTIHDFELTSARSLSTPEGRSHLFNYYYALSGRPVQFDLCSPYGIYRSGAFYPSVLDKKGIVRL